MTVELVHLLFLVGLVTTLNTYGIDERYGVPVSSYCYADESNEVNNILPASRVLPSLPPTPRESAQRRALRSQASTCTSRMSDRTRSTPALSNIDQVVDLRIINDQTNTEMYASFGDVRDAMFPERCSPQPSPYQSCFQSSTTPFSRSLVSLDPARSHIQYEPLVIQTHYITRSPSSTAGYVANFGNFTIKQ